MEKYRGRLTGERVKKMRNLFLIVPLLDVVLIVLVFFTFSNNLLYRHAVEIEVPAAEEAFRVSYSLPTISIAPSGVTFLNGRKVERDDLEILLRLSTEIAEKRGEIPTVLVEAPTDCPLGMLLDLLASVRRAGIRKVNWAVREGE